jgi:hypothetical protein
MPDIPDDPTSALPVEGESATPSTTPAENAPGGNNPQSGGASTGEAPRFPRRRRRRHRRPHPDQITAEGDGPIEAPAAPGDTSMMADLSAPPPHRRRRHRRGPRRAAAAVPPPTDEGTPIFDAAPEVPPSLAQPGGDATDPISTEPHGDAPQPPIAEGSESKPDARPRRRRRRRRPAGPVEAAPVGDALPTETAPAAAGEPRASEHRRRFPRMGARARGEQQTARGAQTDAYVGARPRGPRPRRGPLEGRPDRMQRDANAAERGQAREPRGPRGTERGDRGSRDRRERGRGRSGESERRRGRGRDETKKQVEQRLYAHESVVDRGFEDVADEAADSEPRRVHWTIIKRMVADQNSGKAISAVYVLQRDDVDTEFPNLGAARAAVNKTIVHPEKLTLSKAEHAAAKGDGDGAERSRRQR